MARCLSAGSLVVFLVTPFLGSGCGSVSGPELHAVTFQVQYNGKPAEGATVILDPVNGGDGLPKPTGVVDADGTVRIQTHPHGTGAPAGKYAILVTWFPPDARQSANPKNKLPAKYGAVTTTPLPRITVPSTTGPLPMVALTGP